MNPDEKLQRAPDRLDNIARATRKHLELRHGVVFSADGTKAAIMGPRRIEQWVRGSGEWFERVSVEVVP